MTATAQTWIRAELIAAGSTPFGPQLMIPADGLEFHGTDLVFHCQGEVVYVAEAGQLRSVTWIGSQAHPETSRRKAQWPKHGVRWTDEERSELRDRLLAGDTWAAIAKAHGRSRSGVQQEALKQGWVSADTYQVKEGLADLPHPADAAPADAVPDDGVSPPDAGRTSLPGAVVSALAEPPPTEPQSDRDTEPGSTTVAALDQGPVPVAPPPRFYDAIPAPRSRPELTAGPWAET